MALQKCLGCGKKISTDADQCPKCGEREPLIFIDQNQCTQKVDFDIFYGRFCNSCSSYITLKFNCLRFVNLFNNEKYFVASIINIIFTGL
jgi:hypothetical protein